MRVTTLPAPAAATAEATTVRPAFSVVVVTFNSMKTNAKCLSSVLSTLGPEDELIVVDNASTDDAEAYLRSLRDPRVQVVFNVDNKGYAIAMNQGLRLANGEHVVMLNPDTEVPCNWLERLHAHFRDSLVAAVGPVTDFAGAFQLYHSYISSGIDLGAGVDGFNDHIYAANAGKGLETKLLVGFCMMVSRRALDTVGLLDEDLVLGNDDLDYCWRLREAGFKLIVATDVFVHHESQVSFRTLPPEQTRRKLQESTDALARKLVAHYGSGKVPTARELFGVEWFQPSIKLWEDTVPATPKPQRWSLSEFARDEESGAFLHPAYEGFSYSDGEEVERRIYTCISKASDRSVFSDELQGMITDWPSMYHLTQMRQNLLRHLPFGSDEEVLELGCGCGAITRLLGESGANVTAVEGGLTRAKCAALRCRDLPNVRVYCADFQKPAFDRKFDTVLLIGVLEYSPTFFEGGDPLNACLQLARDLLKPGGRLIVAIENRNGFKYLAGQSEDHVGTPYAGVEDLYQPKTAKTLGRLELAGLLREVGFQNLHFSYPFPDYKVPRVVLTEEALRDDGFRPGEIVRQLRSTDYTARRAPAFRDLFTWPQLAANGLMADLANSFLVVAKREAETSPPQETLLGVFYSLDRLPGLKTTTRFVRTADGSIATSKAVLQPQVKHLDNAHFDWASGEQPYYPGTHLASEAIQRAAGGDGGALLELLSRWVAYARENALEDPSDESWEARVKPEYFDCIPRNLVIVGEDLAFIDREWRYKGTQTLRAMVVRGLVYFLFDHQDVVNGPPMFRASALHLGIPVDRALLDELVQIETELYVFVSGYAHNVRQLFEHYMGKL